MNVHVVTPFSLEKNLGIAYNEAFTRCPEEDWLCLTDYDTMFLLSDTIYHLHEYVKQFPDTGIFTCFTNRIHPSASQQLPLYGISEESNMKKHISIAELHTNSLYTATELKKHISGFLMMISKKTWNEIKFSEDMKCLGVDNDFSDRILESGRSIQRMNGIYIWHTYRLMNGIKDKTHLL